MSHLDSASPRGAYLPAIEVTRGPLVESIHSAAVAVADARGKVLARLGGIEHVVYLRSSAKLFQAMAVVESGAAERFGFTARELAVMAGSHSGEPVHVEAVTEILGRIGLDAGALQCGTHTPFSRTVAEEHRRAGRPFTPLQHNCSGKHAGMLACAVAGGHDPATYLEPRHPVQQRILGILADLTGRMRDRIEVAVDGCSAPTPGVTLSEAARALARLVSPESLSPGHRDAAGRVIAAVRAHPGMIAGQGMLDTELTAHPELLLVSKRGAEGVQALAFVKEGTGVGVAAKVADGDNGRARVALTLELLRQLGVLTPRQCAGFAEASSLVVKSNQGREVGAVRAAFVIQRA